MRQFFFPAEAPYWLRNVLNSIRDALSDVWNTPIRLKDYPTASLPAAADWKQGLAYDSTTVSVKYSDGTNWTGLSAVGHTHTENEILLGATDRLVGRDTAGAGAAEELTVGGGIEFTGSGGIQTSAFTGDVTKAAGGTAQTIPNDTVTYAKMQNVSATDKLLGRSTAGAGDVEEIPCTAAGRAILDDADAAAQRTTLGLGTAATKNTGTSGNTVPLLDGANSWSANQTLAAGNKLILADGAGSDYQGELEHTSSSPYRITRAISRGGTGGWAGSWRVQLNYNGGTLFDAFDVSANTDGTTAFANIVGTFRVNSNQVVGSRITGWATATGTATRTTFDTTTVTLSQLAERVKALIDDLHSSAGHGLIGT